MRLIPFLLVSYALLWLQATLGRILTIHGLEIGPVGPDFLAVFAVFIAMYVRTAGEAALAGWILGFLLDLSTSGGAMPATAVGPMSLAYTVVSWFCFRIRDALFRDRALPQMLLGALFVLLTHTLWAALQALLIGGIGWGGFGELLLQILLSAVFTALLVPMLCSLFLLGRGMVLLPAAGRGRRRDSRRSRGG